WGIPKFDFEVGYAQVNALIEGNAVLTINPFQFAGQVGLEATAIINAFSSDLINGEASANVAIEGTNPLGVEANVYFRADLPIVSDLEEVPLVGDLIGFFEENVAEIPDQVEFEIPFKWEYAGMPDVPELVSKIAVESYFVKGGGELKLVPSENTMNEADLLWNSLR